MVIFLQWMLIDRTYDDYLPKSQSQVFVLDTLSHGHWHASHGYVDAFHVGMGGHLKSGLYRRNKPKYHHRHNTPVQDGMILSKLSGPDLKLADVGLFTKLPDVAPSDFITRLSLNAFSAKTNEQFERIDIAVVAPELQYPIATLRLNENHPNGGGLGELTKFAS